MKILTNKKYNELLDRFGDLKYENEIFRQQSYEKSVYIKNLIDKNERLMSENKLLRERLKVSYSRLGGFISGRNKRVKKNNDLSNR